MKCLWLWLLLCCVVAAQLTFQPAHTIRGGGDDGTQQLIVIVPLSERRTDIHGIAYCFSRDAPMNARKACASPYYQPIALQRSEALVDDATAIRFTVPYWEGRDVTGRFFNPIVYVEVRNERGRLLAMDRIHVEPPDAEPSILTTQEQIEALGERQAEHRNVMWIGISLSVVAAGLVIFGLLWWRRAPVRQQRPDTLEGAIAAADDGGWYHKM